MQRIQVKAGQVWRDKYEGQRYWFVAKVIQDRKANDGATYVDISHVSNGQDYIAGNYIQILSFNLDTLYALYDFVQEAPEHFMCNCPTCASNPNNPANPAQ